MSDIRPPTSKQQGTRAMNSTGLPSGRELQDARLHLRQALDALDRAGELSAAPYVQMALDLLERHAGKQRRR